MLQWITSVLNATRRAAHAKISEEEATMQVERALMNSCYCRGINADKNALDMHLYTGGNLVHSNSINREVYIASLARKVHCSVESILGELKAYQQR